MPITACFEQLELVLVPAGTFDEFELAGALCGLLCAGMPEKKAPGFVLDDLIPLTDLAVSETVALEATAEYAAELSERLRTAEGLFEPDLPEDDESLSARLTALAGWCRGFQIGLYAQGEDKLQPLGEEAIEAVHDLAQFCDLQTDHAETDEEDQEADEEAYMELVEYLRAGVTLIEADIAAAEADASIGPTNPDGGDYQ